MLETQIGQLAYGSLVVPVLVRDELPFYIIWEEYLLVNKRMPTKFVNVHDFYLSQEFYRGEFRKVMTSLLQSIDDTGGVPFFVGGKKKIRTTVVSTCLLALDDMKAISDDLRRSMQSKIISLKDKMDEVDVDRGDTGTRKHSEDKAAWCVGETPSVWSTSYALWALFDTNYKGNYWNEIKKALIWLINQQKADDGWAYQDFRNCQSTIFLTATVLHVLRKAKKLKSQLSLSKADKEKIDKAIKRGLKFILDQKKENGKIAFWITPANEKDHDAVSTTWALWALSEDDPLRHKELIEKGINSLRENLERKEIWEMSKFVDETGTKYDVHKTYYFFTPSLLINLLKLGVNPLDEACIKVIEWLMNNRKPSGWIIEGYDIEEPQTFATALALQTVSTWHKYALEFMIRRRVVEKKAIEADNKLRAKVKVYLGSTFACILLLLAFLSSVYWSNILVLTTGALQYFMSHLLPEAVATILITVGLTIVGWFKRGSVKNVFSSVKKKILY